MLEVSKGSQILLESLCGWHNARLGIFALPRSSHTTLTGFGYGARKCGMHRHQALHYFLVVFPFLLVSVIIGVGFHFDRQPMQIHSSSAPLNSLYWNLLTRGRVLDHDYTLIQLWLLFHHNIGGLGVPCKLLLGLVKHRCMLGLLSLKERIFEARHGVEVLPTCYLSRLIISLHSYLLKTSASSTRACTSVASWTT